MIPSKTEEPCKETGFACKWIWDDIFIDQFDGTEVPSGDLFCRDCYRPRDWDLEEYPSNE